MIKTNGSVQNSRKRLYIFYKISLEQLYAFIFESRIAMHCLLLKNKIKQRSCYNHDRLKRMRAKVIKETVVKDADCPMLPFLRYTEFEL